MTTPAEDHTGEDQFGPFIVEHNEVIRKKAVNDSVNKLMIYILDECDVRIDNKGKERFVVISGTFPVTKLIKYILSLREQP